MQTVAPDPRAMITLREAFETYYLPDLKAEGARSTISGYHTCLTIWERLTPNGPIALIEDPLLMQFKRDALASGYAPATVNKTWRAIRAILRRLGPQWDRNPRGLGYVPRIPYMKPVREDRDFPRLASFEELDALYTACEFAEWPNRRIAPSDWWRCWIVLGYNLCPRTSDLTALRTADISLPDRTLRFVAKKTRKRARFPMNDVVAAHVGRIWCADRERLFPQATTTKRLYGQWRELQTRAGIKEPLEFHEAFRKTGASWFARTSPGIERIILQHADTSVTEAYYLNPFATGGLIEAVKKLPQPASFLKILGDARRDVAPPPKRSDWSFENGGRHVTSLIYRATYRGTTFELAERPYAVLQALLAAGGRSIGFDQLRRLVWWDDPNVSDKTITAAVWRLRAALCDALRIPIDVQPVPFDDKKQSWSLRLP